MSAEGNFRKETMMPENTTMDEPRAFQEASAPAPENQTGLPRNIGDGDETGINPIIGKISIAAALWFLVVIWASFSAHGYVDVVLTVVTLFFVMFFTLFLLTASYTWNDPRWKLPPSTFREFLQRRVGTRTGPMSGREALIEITFLPVMLAVAATIFGIIWRLVG
jgi:hypothetical protein